VELSGRGTGPNNNSGTPTTSFIYDSPGSRQRGEPTRWQDDTRFQAHKFNRGIPEKKDLGVGPYKRGRFFVSPREDPTTFIVNCLIIGVFLYTLTSLSRGEPITVRRKRIIR